MPINHLNEFKDFPPQVFLSLADLLIFHVDDVESEFLMESRKIQKMLSVLSEGKLSCLNVFHCTLHEFPRLYLKWPYYKTGFTTCFLQHANNDFDRTQHTCSFKNNDIETEEN